MRPSRRPFRRRRLTPHIDMTPLIDCVFTLLIVFMLAATFQSPLIQLNLPRAGTKDVAPAPEILVSVDDQSMYYGGSVPTLTGTITGLQNNDNITASYSTTATSTSPVGTYSIDAALNDLDRLFNSLPDSFGNRRLRNGKPDHARAGIANFERALTAGAKQTAERLRQVAQL